MELAISIVSIIVTILLFTKEGEQPLFALIPFLNFHILSRLAGATWAFWGYMAGFICYIFALLSEMPAVGVICTIVMLITTLIVYVRIILVSYNSRVLAIILVVCELLRMFVF